MFDTTMNERLGLWLREREIQGVNKYPRRCKATYDAVLRLGLEHELEGHTGCVNCIEWNSKGQLLASGSDDLHVILWNPFRHKKLSSVRTAHNGNIFSVKFLPYSNDRHIASGAGDNKINIVDIETKELLNIFTLNKGRVKRLAVTEAEPHMLYSAAEDGLIMQLDLRSPEAYQSTPGKPRCVLVNLNKNLGLNAEAKCLCIHPLRTELLAVGANDPYVRLYDRRMIRCQEMTINFDECTDDVEDIDINCVRYFVPAHMASKIKSYRRRLRMLAVTYVAFSPDGRDLLVNLGGEQIYLYDINNYVQPFPVALFESDPEVIVTTEKNGFTRQEDYLPAQIELLKQEANCEFQKQRYSSSIAIYNTAIHKYPGGAVLYSNRAAALLKRNWDGDVYAALKDCSKAIELDYHQHKAFYRLCKCLYMLKRCDDAKRMLEKFKKEFPKHSTGHLFEALEEELADKMKSNGRNSDPGTDNSISENEKVLRSRASDFTQIFSGHCNTTTDIKEANFIGPDGQFICAGSDDGHIHIWDRHTTNLVRVLKGDEFIVNCLQPHADAWLLASSGVDNVVRLWSPLPMDKVNTKVVVDVHQTAAANQKRMNSDPFEIMLLNMGYAVSRNITPDTSTSNDDSDSTDVQCRTF